jgi:hypothetical protein
MRRLITIFALGLGLLGCGSVPPAGEPIQLLTGVSGCYAGGEQGAAGLLLVHPEYGTSFNGVPVMWPVGFTGVRRGDDVEVLDSGGKAVAMTGRRYFISHGPVDAEDKHRLMEKIGAFTAAANCPYPWDFVDCGSPATGSPGMAAPERNCRSR